METTFITIHDLTPDARILYASESIIDILGYSPNEVYSRSCWDFFHPDEVQTAKGRHAKGVEMEKAAVLSYCRMRDKQGNWVGCEVVFTISYDVVVGCTSVYRRGLRSQNRAAEAPVIRRLFSTSPRDPRYHMLSHLSSKFTTPRKSGTREPRASLFLNRYTRTLTIMYATDGLAEVLGMSGEELRGRSFYYCIQENCLPDAVKCLENAKENDSIAYLRFWFRDPRIDDALERRSAPVEIGHDEMEDVQSSEVDAEDRDEIYDNNNHGGSQHGMDGMRNDNERSVSGDSSSTGPRHSTDRRLPHDDSRASSGTSASRNSHEAIFGEPEALESSASSWSTSPSRSPATPLELEAVISCSSDGLVVCMRQATAPPADLKRYAEGSYANGLFAVPWASEPLLPSIQQRQQYAQTRAMNPRAPLSFSRPAVPQTVRPQQDLMAAIKDIAVFAWAITGINGSLAEYGHGQPRGESQPAAGLHIWKPEAEQRNIEEGGAERSGQNGDK